MVVNPRREPRPFIENRLVSNLHGGPAGHRVTVESEQSVLPERLQHKTESDAVDADVYALVTAVRQRVATPTGGRL